MARLCSSMNYSIWVYIFKYLQNLFSFSYIQTVMNITTDF